MLKKLRLKFICVNMLIVFVMLCVIFGMVYHFTRRQLETQSDRMMQSILAEPIQMGRPGEGTVEARLPYFTLQISSFGNVIAVGDSYFDLSDEAYLESLIASVQNKPEESGVLEDYNLRYRRVSSPLGERWLFVDISSEQTTLNNLLKNSLIIGGVSLLLFLGISILLARWAVKPVEKAWSQQRRFVGDASHELKTPLTVILTNAELLQDPAYGEEKRNQFAENILTMSRQMRGLVESLLDLTRVDNGVIGAAMEQIDFSRLMSDAILPFEPLYFEKGKMLSCDIAEAIFVEGSAQHLRQVAEILLDNAMKYSPPESAVNVTLKAQGTHCLFAVASTGEPISKEELKLIFERFYRVNKARSMDQSYGLGLSIAEGIVREHQGKIWAESENGLNTFFVQLPIL